MKIVIKILLILVLMAQTTLSVMAQQSTDTVDIRFGNPRVESEGNWPTSGEITQGPRGSSSHGPIGLNAIDIANVANTPIYATFDGVARAFDCSNSGGCDLSRGKLGNYVMINPDFNPRVEILFAHLFSISIPDGAKVKKGDIIGKMGMTGRATGVHLHYEFRGIFMSRPNIPEDIVPVNCDPAPCTPRFISADSVQSNNILTPHQKVFVLRP